MADVSILFVELIPKLSFPNFWKNFFEPILEGLFALGSLLAVLRRPYAMLGFKPRLVHAMQIPGSLYSQPLAFILLQF